MTRKKKGSHTTSPITDRDDLRRLLTIPEGRDKLLFHTAIYTGLRAGEILACKWKDFVNEDGVKYETKFPCPKQGKYRDVRFHPRLRQVVIDEYKGQNLEDWMFLPKKGTKKFQPMTVVGFNKVIKKWFEKLDIKIFGNVSAHALRKTFARMHYEQYEDLPFLMKVLGHSSQAVTLRYIGVESEDIRASFMKLDIFGEGNLISKIQNNEIQVGGVVAYLNSQGVTGDAVRPKLYEYLYEFSQDEDEIESALEYLHKKQ